MNQRINPDTGYPMSTDKQIKQAKDLLELSEPHLSEEDIASNLTNPYFSKLDKLNFCISTLTSPYEFKADYFYKLGDYEKSEDNYLQIFFLNFKFCNRLKIIYQREKRYKDAMYITDFALNTFSEFPFLIADNQMKKLKRNVSSTQSAVQRHSQEDKSIIDGESKVWIVQTASKKLHQIKEWSSEIDNITANAQQTDSTLDSDNEPSEDNIAVQQQPVDEPQDANSNTKKGGIHPIHIGCVAAIIWVFIAAFLGQAWFGDIGAQVFIGISVLIIIALDIWEMISK